MNRSGYVMRGLCALAMAVSMAFPAMAEVEYLDISPDIGLTTEMHMAVLVLVVEAPAEYVVPELATFERLQAAQAPEGYGGRTWGPLAYVSTPSIAASHLIGRAAFG